MKSFTAALFIFLTPCTLAAQATSVVPVANVTAKSYTRYPSLEPVNAITVTLGDIPSGIFDAIKGASATPGWNCLSPDFYEVAVVDKSLNVKRKVQIKSVQPQGNDPSGKPFINCNAYLTNAALPGSVDLLLESQVNTNDLIRVFIYHDKQHTSLVGQSDGKLSFASGRVFTLNATPQAAPGEALTNGKKRDVGQLTVALADTNLVPGSPVNVYANSKDLFSTDSKDSKSSFLATVGVQRGLFPRWYAPLYFEQGIQGNQAATNLSTVTNLGIKTLLPWAWSKKAFNNSVIAAPLPPDLTVVNQYTHRINQLAAPKSPLLSVNDYSLNPAFSWQSITFPPTCKLFNWLNRSKGGYCLGTEVNLGVWYLPLDLTASKSQRVEGYGDASILLPLAGFSFASKIFPYITSSDPSKVQIRIKYADSVNAANNYARSRQWTYGLEVIK